MARDKESDKVSAVGGWCYHTAKELVPVACHNAEDFWPVVLYSQAVRLSFYKGVLYSTRQQIKRRDEMFLVWVCHMVVL